MPKASLLKSFGFKETEPGRWKLYIWGKDRSAPYKLIYFPRVRKVIENDLVFWPVEWPEIARVVWHEHRRRRGLS